MLLSPISGQAATQLFSASLYFSPNSTEPKTAAAEGERYKIEPKPHADSTRPLAMLYCHFLDMLLLVGLAFRHWRSFKREENADTVVVLKPKGSTA
jgi:hypothetical protein